MAMVDFADGQRGELGEWVLLAHPCANAVISGLGQGSDTTGLRYGAMSVSWAELWGGSPLLQGSLLLWLPWKAQLSSGLLLLGIMRRTGYFWGCMCLERRSWLVCSGKASPYTTLNGRGCLVPTRHLAPPVGCGSVGEDEEEQ